MKESAIAHLKARKSFFFKCHYITTNFIVIFHMHPSKSYEHATNSGVGLLKGIVHFFGGNRLNLVLQS